MWRFKAVTDRIIHGAETATAGLDNLASVLAIIERTSFVSPRLMALQADLETEGLPPSRQIRRLNRLMTIADMRLNWFVKIAAPVSGELIPVLDLEVTGGLSTTQLQNWSKAFLDRVYTLTGVKGAIYVSPSFWTNNAGNWSGLASAGYKVLWIAHWTTGSQPTVPANNWGSNSWTFWQYTSSGTVSGISGRVDLNRYKFTTWSKVLIP